MLPAKAGSIWPITACAECQQTQRPALEQQCQYHLSDAHAQETPKEVVYAEVAVERVCGGGAVRHGIGGNGCLDMPGSSCACSDAGAAQNRRGAHGVGHQLHLAQSPECQPG